MHLTHWACPFIKRYISPYSLDILLIDNIFIFQYVTFQIVLITDGDATFCRFNYGTLQFDSGSSNGIPAQVSEMTCG